jgi:hypothetical protein
LFDFFVLDTTSASYPSLSEVLMSATKLPHTEITVTGMDVPSSKKRRDIPDFFPIKPVLNLLSFLRGY